MQKDSSFAEDLFKLTEKELSKSRKLIKTKIAHQDPDTLEEMEITRDYLNKKIESRIKSSNSKLFEKIEDFGKEVIEIIKQI